MLTFSLPSVGTLIISRHPDNRIGWILLALGLFGAFAEVAEGWGQFADEYGLPGGAAGEWLIFWSWIVELSGWALVFLLFPDGHLPSRGWRAWPWVLGLGVALALPGQALAPGHASEFTGAANPMGREEIPTALLLNAGLTLMLLTMAAGLTALVARFRSGTSVERQQVKWFAFAASLLIVVGTAAIFFWYESVLVQVLFALALIALPIGAGISIFKVPPLRYIDVVINRTLVYGGLNCHAGCFLPGQRPGPAARAERAHRGLRACGSRFDVGSGGALPSDPRSHPATVDRRFYRRKYDAERSLEGFRTRLRGEVAIDSVSTELQRAVAETMQPAHVSLWLHRPERLP